MRWILITVWSASKCWTKLITIKLKLAWMKWGEWLCNEYKMKQQSLVNTGDISPEIA